MTTPPDHERAIVAAAREGDGAAFEALVRAHSPRLRGLLVSLGASPEDADDAMQETLVAAHRALPRFRGDATLRSWLGRIAINSYRDLVRATRRVFALPDSVAEKTAASPADRLARRETLGRVLEAMDGLPPRQREALRLRVVEGLDYRQIAERMGVGRDAVRMNLVEARRKLGRRFGRDPGAS